MIPIRAPFRFRLHLVFAASLALPAACACAQNSPTLALVDAPSFTLGLGAAPSPQTAPLLHITILEGEGALNNIRERTAREPMVQVEDQNHKPVAGALVLFSIHAGPTGAGGSFAGASTLSVTTGADGRAIAHGLQLNQTQGQFTIHVQATSGNLSTETDIHQSNTSGSSSSSSNSDETSPATQPTTQSTATRVGKLGAKRAWILGGTAGAVAATLLYFSVRSTATSITAGTGTVAR